MLLLLLWLSKIKQLCYYSIQSPYNFITCMQILIHTDRMARILHIGQKFENFQAFESAIERYQNAENVKFYKRDSRSVEKVQVRISYKVNERLKYYENYMRLHSDVSK